jgi:hypothetical protein
MRVRYLIVPSESLTPTVRDERCWQLSVRDAIAAFTNWVSPGDSMLQVLRRGAAAERMTMAAMSAACRLRDRNFGKRILGRECWPRRKDIQYACDAVSDEMVSFAVRDE